MFFAGNLSILLWTLSIAVQVASAVHVVKTGRPYWWLWIIIIAPGIGAAVYFLAEVVPDLHRDPAVFAQPWHEPVGAAASGGWWTRASR